MPVIALIFIPLSFLLLWFIIGARGKWWIKLPIIIGIPLLAFVIWSALNSFSGWPTANKPPIRSLFISAIIDEPNVQQNDNGAIYIWLIPEQKPNILSYQPSFQEPRSYKFPYSRKLHEEVQAAINAQKQGNQVEIRNIAGKLGKSGLKGDYEKNASVHFYVLPKPQLPRKINGQ